MGWVKNFATSSPDTRAEKKKELQLVKYLCEYLFNSSTVQLVQLQYPAIIYILLMKLQLI